jgi:hypothetical protein
MTLRFFTVEEAQRLVPTLTRLMSTVRELKARADEKTVRWRRFPSDNPVDVAMVQGRLDFAAREINSLMREVLNLGCVPKDVDAGLVDFPARVEGKHGYLCWRLGEERVEFWHSLTGGYGERLPLPAAAYRSPAP